MGKAHLSFSGRQNRFNRHRVCAFSLIGVEIQLIFRLRRYIRIGEVDTTPTVKLLIIEDSQKLLEALTTGLRKLGNAVDACRDGEEGLKFSLNATHDIIVLDLMLPGLDDHLFDSTKAATAMRSKPTSAGPVRSFMRPVART